MCGGKGREIKTQKKGQAKIIQNKNDTRTEIEATVTGQCRKQPFIFVARIILREEYLALSKRLKESEKSGCLSITLPGNGGVRLHPVEIYHIVGSNCTCLSCSEESRGEKYLCISQQG